MIDELAIGKRRTDLAFVGERDLFVVEIKSRRDKLDRLDAQLEEFGLFFPEVWVAVDPKHMPRHADYGHPVNKARNVLIVKNGKVAHYPPANQFRKAHRNEIVIVRLLERLWTSEAERIALRTGCIPAPMPGNMNRWKIVQLLARMLTGNEILREVCAELRARPLTGIGSDPPVEPQQGGA